ncbi:MAG: nitrogen regulation protein NR(II) [Gammaproteobacteria bacterium]|nr:nitrogen regulation protein NR(II) [Gammaproteobacteria bacterium]
MTSARTDQRILENLNTAVLLFNNALELKYINPAGEILFEASARQIAGQPATRLFPESPEFIEALGRSLHSGHPYTERGASLRLPDLRMVSVDVTVTPLQEPNEHELLLELLQVDRHMRIAREENLIAQYNNTRMLMRGMAHEINNPLGGLRGAAQLLERELSDDTLKEYTRVIIGEADRLQSLLSRMLGPNAIPLKRMVNIHEVTERVRALIQAEAGEGISILRDYDPSIPELFADADQLIQAVLNITRNALQAINGNGSIMLQTRTQRQFTLGPRTHKLAVQINIIDSGPGIPPDMIEKIFYPMISGRAGGTGLGLPIAQSIVNQHGGLIECTSQPGNTVFSIILPLEEHHEQQ